MTAAELERVSRIIDSITLSAHNAKTSIVSADEGRVICEPKRAGGAITAFFLPLELGSGPAVTGLQLLHSRTRKRWNSSSATNQTMSDGSPSPPR